MPVEVAMEPVRVWFAPSTVMPSEAISIISEKSVVRVQVLVVLFQVPNLLQSPPVGVIVYAKERDGARKRAENIKNFNFIVRRYYQKDYETATLNYTIPRFFNSQKHLAVISISTAALWASGKSTPNNFT